MKLELISFKICPFVQRAEIMLLEKDIEHDITYIDLKNPPDWFLDISPLGKVPLLRVGDVVLFESAIISEYLDEIHPPSMHPHDPLQKALNRSTIELVSSIIFSHHNLVCNPGEDLFHTNLEKINAELSRLSGQVKGNSYFNGQTFSLVDMAAAPLLQRISLAEATHRLNLLNDHPKLAQWWHNLKSRDSVRHSVVEDFDRLYLDYVKQANGYFAQYL
jgi:glutathione S-transferase